VWYVFLLYVPSISSTRVYLLEYAGEIKDAFPRKKVIIVHSDSQLLNSAYPNKYRKRVEKDIATRGIDIVFNDYVDNFTSLPASTRSGRPLEGDLAVRAPWDISALDFFFPIIRI
jgi:apoptosis-inducing factor 2